MSPDPESVFLPRPPPPRPVRREAAIDAALRQFDRVDDAPRARPATRGWTRHPQLGLALAALLLVVIGLPATFIALQSQDSNPAFVSAPSAVSPRAAGPQQDRIARNGPPATSQPAQPQTAFEPSLPPDAAAPKGAKEEGRPVDVPAMPVVAAAPPPPAPPPPAPILTQKAAENGADGVVVTGSRIARPNLTSASPVTVLEDRSAERDEPAAVNLAEQNRAYASFLGRLQAAVRADDRGAIVRLIRFPLRVNSDGRSQIYPDAKSVRRDYETIFTPRVRQSILAQRADRLFSRDLGVMIGDGEVWFDHGCLDDACSRLGPVRITAINR